MSTVAEFDNSLQMDLVDILWNNDIDMGVSRELYDPLYEEKRKQMEEMEQAKIAEQKKLMAQLESLYFKIDGETGEKIPYSHTEQPLYLAELYKGLMGFDLPSENLLMDLEASLLPKETESSIMQPQEINGFNSAVFGADNIYTYGNQELPVNLLNNGVSLNTIKLEPAMSRTTDLFQYITEPAEPYHNISAMESTPYQALFKSDEPDISLDDLDIDMIVTDAENVNYLYNYVNSSEDDGTFIFDNVSSNTAYSVAEDSKSDAGFFEYDSATPEVGGSPKFSELDHSDSSENKAQVKRSSRFTTKDEAKCKELGIPFTVDGIINLPVEQFTVLLREHELTEEQLELIKDIRRRGKNKVAAQNCRKKKVTELFGLEDEIKELRRKKAVLMKDKLQLQKTKADLENGINKVNTEILSMLSEELGSQFDPQYYDLQFTEDWKPVVDHVDVTSFPVLDFAF